MKTSNMVRVQHDGLRTLTVRDVPPGVYGYWADQADLYVRTDESDYPLCRIADGVLQPAAVSDDEFRPLRRGSVVSVTVGLN